MRSAEPTERLSQLFGARYAGALPPAKVHRFQVSEQDVGLRLDQLLARRVPDLSRGKARLVIDLGGVFVDRKRVKVARRALRVGQRVEVYSGSVLERAARQRTGETAISDPSDRLDARQLVRYVDDHLVVVDKPSGVLSAPTPESDRTNLQSWLTANVGGAAYVVHRLDRLTSGLIVYARTSTAASRLSALLHERSLVREYRVAVAGGVDFERRELSSPVRNRPARTEFWCLEKLDDVVSLLGARLATGRTHQIRVHAAALGHPVAGDPLYGRASTETVRAPRLALHAHRLAFPHPVDGRALQFESPWPADLAAWLEQLSKRCEPGTGPSGTPGSDS